MKSALLFCVLLSSLATYSLADPFVSYLLKGVDNSIQNAFDLAGKAAEKASKLTGHGVQMGTDIGKMGVVAATTLAKEGVQHGVELGKDGFKLAGSIMELIPFMKMPASAITQLGQEGLEFANTIAGKGINAAATAGHHGLNYTNNIAQLVTKTVENISNGTVQAGKGVSSATIGALGNVAETIRNTTKTFISGGIDAVKSQANQQATQWTDVKPTDTDNSANPAASSQDDSSRSSLSRFFG